jgi:hypothetical protein
MNHATEILRLLAASNERANAASKTPLRVEGPHQCNRTINDPGDVHYSVFDEYCGNVAHFHNKSDAEFYASSRTDIPRLTEAIEVLVKALQHYQVWTHLGAGTANQALSRAHAILTGENSEENT